MFNCNDYFRYIHLFTSHPSVLKMETDAVVVRVDLVFTTEKQTDEVIEVDTRFSNNNLESVSHLLGSEEVDIVIKVILMIPWSLGRCSLLLVSTVTTSTCSAPSIVNSWGQTMRGSLGSMARR